MATVPAATAPLLPMIRLPVKPELALVKVRVPAPSTVKLPELLLLLRAADRQRHRRVNRGRCLQIDGAAPGVDADGVNRAPAASKPVPFRLSGLLKVLALPGLDSNVAPEATVTVPPLP